MLFNKAMDFVEWVQRREAKVAFLVLWAVGVAKYVSLMVGK